jgi:hypothetical protein
MKKDTILNWEKVVEQGFGNRSNICVWSLAKYKDYLYAGTMNFKNGCQVYRSKSGNKGSWKQVNPDGFGNKESTGARNMIVYKNLLWVVTFSPEIGAQVWVTNGEKSDKNDLIIWKKANINAFGKVGLIYASRATVIFKDKLYVGTQVKSGLPQIYRYDGNTDFDKIEPNNWSLINKDMDNSMHNIPRFSLIGKMVNFKTQDGKEYIYVGMYPEIAGKLRNLKRVFKPSVLMQMIEFFTLLRCNIYRYDGVKWEKIAKPGFGKLNVMTMSSVVLNNNIYFGTTNIFGSEIWKSKDGNNWIRVMKKGFNNPFNISVYRLHTFENKLIVGLQNQWMGCQIWASVNDDPLNNKDFIQIASYGLSEFKSINPLKLKQDGIRFFETFNGQLYAGTASNYNIFMDKNIGPGCEIWRIGHL